jgi:hypothetical protein
MRGHSRVVVAVHALRSNEEAVEHVTQRHDELCRLAGQSRQSRRIDHLRVDDGPCDRSIERCSFSFRIQILLLSDVERVRAASLRALRYSIHRAIIFDKFLEYRLDYLVCR